MGVHGARKGELRSRFARWSHCFVRNAPCYHPSCCGHNRGRMPTHTKGGTRIESWSSPEALAACPVDTTAGCGPGLGTHPLPRMNSTNSGNLCSAAYNGMLHPLLPMRFSAMIWYQVCQYCAAHCIWCTHFVPWCVFCCWSPVYLFSAAWNTCWGFWSVDSLCAVRFCTMYVAVGRVQPRRIRRDVGWAP